jgi:hypothetical protein
VPWCTICALTNRHTLATAVVCRRVFYKDGTIHDFLCCRRHRSYPLDGIAVRSNLTG